MFGNRKVLAIVRRMGAQNRQFCQDFGCKNRPYAPNFDYSGKFHRWDLDPTASAAVESKMPFRGVKMGDSGARTPPGFEANRNVSRAKTEISLPDMLPNGEMLGSNPPNEKAKIRGDRSFGGRFHTPSL